MNHHLKACLAISAALVTAAAAAPSVVSAASGFTATVPIEAYGSLPNIESASMSQSGRFVAAVGMFDGSRSVIVADETGAIKVRLPIGQTKINGVAWAGDDFVVVYARQTAQLPEGFTRDKAETSAALILPASGGAVKQAFVDSPLIVSAILGRYGIRKVDGRWQAYYAAFQLKRSTSGVHNRLDFSKGEFTSNAPALFAVDLATNKPRQVAPAARPDHRRDWLVDGQGAVAAYLDYSGLDKTWQLHDAQGKTIASGKSPNADVTLDCFGTTGTTLIYSYSDAERRNHYYEVPLAGGTPTPFLPDAAVDALYIDPQTSTFVGHSVEGTDGQVRFAAADRVAAMNKIAHAFPKVNVTVRSWSNAFDHVVIRTDGNRNSGTWYDVDVAHLRASAIGQERPGIAPDQVGSISRVAYTAADGLSMDGILTLPPGRDAKGLPLVVLPHGGPHAQDDVSFDWWAQAFASRGYAVFQPNFRGSTGRGKSFVDAAYNEWGRKMQTDISDGVAHLAKIGIVDPNRACIVGGSYGGYAALAGVTLQNGLYRCAVSVAGVSDLWQMYRSDDAGAGYDADNWRELKRFLGDPSGYSAVSPARHADKADAPVMLIHGKDDTIVPFSQTTTMADALKDAGKPYELVVLNGEDHWLSRSETRTAMLKSAIGFVEKYNPAN